MLKHMLTTTPSTPSLFVGHGEGSEHQQGLRSSQSSKPGKNSNENQPSTEFVTLDDMSLLAEGRTSSGGGDIGCFPTTPNSKIGNCVLNGSCRRPVSVHGHLIHNQSIYANTVAVPKVQQENGSLPGLSTSAMLNTSRLSSSNSPATTNQTHQTLMDSSREGNHDDLLVDMASFPPPPSNVKTYALNRNASYLQQKQRQQTATPTITPPFDIPKDALGEFAEGALTPIAHLPHKRQTPVPQLRATPGLPNRSLNASSVLNHSGYPHNSTMMHPSSFNTSAVAVSAAPPDTPTSRSFHSSSLFSPIPNVRQNQRCDRRDDEVGRSRFMNSSLVPANVSRFLQLSRDAGVKEAITSLGLLCLASLLLALLSLVFLLKLSPVTEKRKEELYPFDFLTTVQFLAMYEVTLGLCALSLSLNLCCLLVCAIQFLFAVKLIKASPERGKSRTTKYLHEAAVTRICAIGGFFLSIPVFLTGIILYTFLHFDSTPAIVTSVVIGLAIVFCGGAVVHNVFLWRKESRASRLVVEKGGGNGKEADSVKNLPMSPILKRVFDNERQRRQQQQKSNGIFQKSYIDLPNATMDLSGGAGGSLNASLNITKNKSMHQNASSRALELSTLV